VGVGKKIEGQGFTVVVPPALEQGRRYWSSWKDRAVAELGSQGSLFSDQVRMCDSDRIGIYDPPRLWR